MSLTGAAIRILIAKGLSAEDIADVADANAGATMPVQQEEDRRLVYSRERQRAIKPEGCSWQEMRLRIFDRDGWVCVYCSQPTESPHCDHVFPVALGGKSVESNLVTACPPCNLKKGSKLWA